MGSPKDYTYACCPSAVRRQKPQEFEDTRRSLPGNSFHVPTVAWVMLHVLVQVGILPCVPKPAASSHEGRLTWTGPPAEQKHSAPIIELVRHLLAKQRFTGGALLHQLGCPTTSQACVQAVDPQLWHWRVAIFTAWKQKGEHINVLEGRTHHLMLWWRLRKATNHNAKFLHLVDSRVALAS